MSLFSILGIVFMGVGVVAAIFPDWFGFLTGGPEPPASVYDAIERRIRGGMLFGVGLAFFAVTALHPWSTSIPTAIFYFMAGALAARVLGLIVDGFDSKQWLWVAVEAVAMALAAIWLWYSNRSA